jgi:hypothetical protein
MTAPETALFFRMPRGEIQRGFFIFRYQNWGPQWRDCRLCRRIGLTPETSAEAAVKWLHYKGRIDEKTTRLGPYQGH